MADQLSLDDASDIYQQLSSQEFIEHLPDGLCLYNPLKQALASSLKTRSPQEFSLYRNRIEFYTQRYTTPLGSIRLEDNC
jgi:hypothetical protein